MCTYESIPTERLIIESQFQVVAMRVNIRKNFTITIANIYLPGTANFERGEMCRLINSLKNPKIIVEYFNAHKTAWVNKCTDRRGRILEAIFVEQGLNMMNNGSATLTSGTAIDLTVVSGSLLICHSLATHLCVLPPLPSGRVRSGISC